MLSHWCAAAIHGLPLIGEWPSQVHVTVSPLSGARITPLIFVGETDFHWPSFELVGEADGDRKYRDDAYRSGRTLEQVMMVTRGDCAGLGQ